MGGLQTGKVHQNRLVHSILELNNNHELGDVSEYAFKIGENLNVFIPSQDKKRDYKVKD